MPTGELPLPVLDALPLGAHRIMALTHPALEEACGVRVAFFGRTGGVSQAPYDSLNCGYHVDDDPALVKRNQQLVCEAVDAPFQNLVRMNQVHGTHFVHVPARSYVPRALQQGAEGADGAVVRAAEVPVLINSADCAVVAVVSPSGSFSICHAGWRGAVQGIAAKAVQALAADDPYDPCTYNAYIAPHIRGECFQVGAEVAEAFTSAFGASVLQDDCHVSLARALILQLQDAGLVAQRVADAEICTSCNTQAYYSYRAEDGTCGRQASVVYRRPNGS